MFYSVAYGDRELMKDATEIVVRPAANNLRLFDYVKENPDKRYNFAITEYPDENLLKFMSDKNCVFACKDLNIMKKLIAEGHKAYYDYPIADWESYQRLIKLGVSDIWIDSQLCFNKSKMINRGKLVLRAVPTVSPTSSMFGEPQANTFFILPQHIDMYSGYFDIYDFSAFPADKQKTLVNIYTKKEYFGHVNTLIQGLDINIPTNMITTAFTKKRLDCGQRCMEAKGTCTHCRTQLEFEKVIYNALIEKNN